jgi:fumarate hydratase subunit beta
MKTLKLESVEKAFFSTLSRLRQIKVLQRSQLPLSSSNISALKAGDMVLLSGVVYTARDAAHKRLAELIRKGKKLPIPVRGQALYYTGPTPAPKGRAIGSCGPTTSSRMDEFTPILLKAGLKAMIGKGNRSAEVAKAIRKYKAVYFLALAGCGALLSRYVKKAEVIAYKDLGTEAIRRLEIRDFPVIVGVDSKGTNIFR